MEIQHLVGKTFNKVSMDDSQSEICFEGDQGNYKMFHSQDCCESVSVDDVVGDLNDLVGTPILSATEDTSNENPQGVHKEYQDSFTWTFYNIATIKGHVTIRWYGESNGWYSERVELEKY